MEKLFGYCHWSNLDEAKGRRSLGKNLLCMQSWLKKHSKGSKNISCILQIKILHAIQNHKISHQKPTKNYQKVEKLSKNYKNYSVLSKNLSNNQKLIKGIWTWNKRSLILVRRDTVIKTTLFPCLFLPLSLFPHLIILHLSPLPYLTTLMFHFLHVSPPLSLVLPYLTTFHLSLFSLSYHFSHSTLNHILPFSTSHHFPYSTLQPVPSYHYFLFPTSLPTHLSTNPLHHHSTFPHINLTRTTSLSIQVVLHFDNLLTTFYILFIVYLIFIM